MKVVYISHPFGSDPSGNAESVRRICRGLARDGYAPLAPQLLLPQFLDEGSEREAAMALCLRFVALADEVGVYGAVTDGMAREIAEAARLGIPVWGVRVR